jgi:hypothetical protein
MEDNGFIIVPANGADCPGERVLMVCFVKGKVTEEASKRSHEKATCCRQDSAA